MDIRNKTKLGRYYDSAPVCLYILERKVCRMKNILHKGWKLKINC